MLLVIIELALLFMTVNRHSLAVLYISIAVISLICFLILYAFIGVFIMIYMVSRSKPPGAVGLFFIRTVILLYPVALRIGRILHIDGDSIRASFIELNNQLVRSNKLNIQPEKILILLPHCLQKYSCEKKVSNFIENCTGCGQCDIAEIRDLGKKLGVSVAVVTGGTLARKTISMLRPKVVVAVACERDLFSGIMDARPIPAVGVVNKRPEGACINTRVDLEQLESMVRYFLPAEQTQPT